MWLHTYYRELYHYGIKGMKWGVRRGPPYPLKDGARRDTIVKDAIASGQVSKKINREKQYRHTLHGHTPGRSYLDGDLDFAQALVDKLSGTGSPVLLANDKWLRKERVTSPYIIGTLILTDGTKKKTNAAMIVYSKTGTHIYPRKEEE